MKKADLQSHAMSPMFLGGLTARAIQWAHLAQQRGTAIIEAYPKLVAQHLALDMRRYKKDASYLEAATGVVKAHLNELTSLSTLPTPLNWHQFDAVLALCTAVRFSQGKAVPLGDKEEGVLYF